MRRVGCRDAGKLEGLCWASLYLITESWISAEFVRTAEKSFVLYVRGCAAPKVTPSDSYKLSLIILYLVFLNSGCQSVLPLWRAAAPQFLEKLWEHNVFCT